MLSRKKGLIERLKTDWMKYDKLSRQDKHSAYKFYMLGALVDSLKEAKGRDFFLIEVEVKGKEDWYQFDQELFNVVYCDLLNAYSELI